MRRDSSPREGCWYPGEAHNLGPRSFDSASRYQVKPEGPVARREDYEIVACPHAQAAALVKTHHYARSAANTSTHAHCLRRKADGEVVGAVLWMPPTAAAAKSLARRHLADPARHREVLNLSRLVVAPGEPKNTAGMLLGGSERLVRQDPRWSLFVTFADPLRGHTGTIYKATNWQEDGLSWPETVWHCEGQQRSVVGSAPGRSGRGRKTRRMTHAEMRAAGCVPTGKSRKIRFVKKVR